MCCVLVVCVQGDLSRTFVSVAGNRGSVLQAREGQGWDGGSLWHLEYGSCRFLAISFLPAPPHQDKRLHEASGSFLNSSSLSLCSDFLFLLQFSEAHHL